MAFGATPLSSHPTAVFEVAAPLLVTETTDPIIVDNPFGFFPGRSTNAFPDDDDGFLPSSCSGGAGCILGSYGANGAYIVIGIAPTAGPLCTTSTCPPPSASTYPLCASLPTNGNGAARVPSVAAFYAIAGNGAEVLLSTPTEPTGPFVCPSGM